MRAVSLAAAVMVVGCGQSPVVVSDSVDITFDMASFWEGDVLHTPYVRGAEMTLRVSHRKDKRLEGWTVTSLDPDVFAVEQLAMAEDEHDLKLSGAAHEEGTATLVIKDDDGDEVDRVSVEVALPDEVALLAHGPLLLNQPELADDGTPQVLVGGTSTWLARYYRDGERLYGHGVLSVGDSDAFSGWVETTFLFEDRDWLQGIAEVSGAFDVPLLVDGEPIRDVAFEAVTEDAIDRIELHAEDEAGAEEEDSLLVLAQAYDSADRPIYAVEFEWSVDGVEELGEGDLYRYSYDPDDPNDLEATLDDQRDAVTIHGDGYVSSTNNVGCASVSARGSAGLLALAAGLMGLRRRRQGDA